MTELPEADYFVASSAAATGNIRWFRYNPNPAGRRDIGQIFRAPASRSINRLLLQIAPLDPPIAVGKGVPGAAFTLRVYEYSDVEQLTQAAPISSQAGRLPDTLRPGQILAIDFEPIELKEDQLYAFVLSLETTGDQCFINLTRSPSRGDTPDQKLLIYTPYNTATPNNLTYHEEDAGLYFQLTHH